MEGISKLRHRLESGRTNSRELVAEALARINDGAGEGKATFLSVRPELVHEQARTADMLRRIGRSASPFAGIPVSIKDLFDVRGETTLAGSRVLAGSAQATADAVAVARLRSAGFVIMGRTNMTEFAYSGLGLNPHFGTPRNPYQRNIGLIPGGSSSGAAVSVTDGMVAAALGTDTGGSCRIPAALCGIVGFKPSAGRIPMQGMVPLSPSMDSVGVLAPTVECCAILDQYLAGEVEGWKSHNRDRAPLRIGRIVNYVEEGMDDSVAGDYQAATAALRSGNWTVEDIRLPELEEIPGLFVNGGITAAEAYRWHRELIEKKADLYDPLVLSRIILAREQGEGAYPAALAARSKLMVRANRAMSGFDFLVCPTTPIVAPPLAKLAEPAEYAAYNRLMLRNPMIANLFDWCSISLPMHMPGNAPTGLMLFAANGRDRSLLSQATHVSCRLQDQGG